VNPKPSPGTSFSYERTRARSPGSTHRYGSDRRPVPRSEWTRGQTDAELHRTKSSSSSKKAPRPHELGRPETNLGLSSVPATSGSLCVAERLGADEEEGSARLLYAPEGSRSPGSACQLVAVTSRPNLAQRTSTPGSLQVAKWLEYNYGYGHSKRSRGRRPIDLLNALQLTNPKVRTLPYSYLDATSARVQLYAKMWEDVKAS